MSRTFRRMDCPCNAFISAPAVHFHDPFNRISVDLLAVRGLKPRDRFSRRVLRFHANRTRRGRGRLSRRFVPEKVKDLVKILPPARGACSETNRPYDKCSGVALPPAPWNSARCYRGRVLFQRLVDRKAFRPGPARYNYCDCASGPGSSPVG